MSLQTTITSARALCDYEANDVDEISFKQGDIITVVTKFQNSDWWLGSIAGEVGYFPHSLCLLSLDEAPPFDLAPPLKKVPS